MKADSGIQFDLFLLLPVLFIVVGLIFIILRSGVWFAAATIGAIVAGVAIAAATATLFYVLISENNRHYLWLIPILLSLTVFGAFVGFCIRRLRPDKTTSYVSLGLGLISVLMIDALFLIVIGCQHGECINL